MSKNLEKLNNFEGVKGPLLTIVMDGVGLAPDTVSNAVTGAYTPNLARGRRRPRIDRGLS